MSRPELPVSPQRAAAIRGDRIAKLLARAGIASRREIERMIADGRIARDGVAVDTPATLLTSLAGVTVDGRPVAAPAPAQLFAYHKPAGLLVTERDPRGRPTIYDRLPAGLPRVVPVGRLDLATEGLLLLTTDGGLKRQLELPANGVERTYRARAHGAVSQAQLEELIHGIEIDGIRYGAIDANLERRTGSNAWIELTLTEGKNREVRRVLEHLGLQVGRLIRTRYGPFVLGELPAGAVGEVRQHDLIAFRRSLDRKGGGAPTALDRVEVSALPAATSERPAPVQTSQTRRPEIGAKSDAREARPTASGRSGPGKPRPAMPARKDAAATSPRLLDRSVALERSAKPQRAATERPRTPGSPTATTGARRPSRPVAPPSPRPTRPRGRR